MNKPGDRVGAVLSASPTQVDFLGYGVYEGDFVPEEGRSGLAAHLREHQLPNPRIKLDNGRVVYGYECWWGSEEKIRWLLAEREAGGAKIVEVPATDGGAP